MSVSLRQLRAFSTVALLGSFAEAAQVLHVTPAALSMTVRQLEDLLGFRLFDRTTRQVSLTPSGRDYLHYAEQVLFEVRRAERFAQDVRHQRSGVVRISMTQVMAWALMPPLFARFQARWPRIRIEPTDVPTEQIVASVEDGRADLALSFETPMPDTLEGTPLFRSRVHVVCPASHPFARCASVSWDAMAHESVIFIGRGSELRLRAELPPSLHLETRHEAGNTVTGLGMAAGGMGVLVCAGYVEPLLALHDLRAVPLIQPEITHRFVLYRSRARSMAPAVEAWRSFLLDSFAPLGELPVEQAGPLTEVLKAD